MLALSLAMLCLVLLVTAVVVEMAAVVQIALDSHLSE